MLALCPDTSVFLKKRSASYQSALIRTDTKPEQRRPSHRLRLGTLHASRRKKGLHVLANAYRLLREREGFPGARLEVAGYLGTENRDYLSGIEKMMNECGFGDEFHYRGILDRNEKISFLRGLDVLSVPATYDEPKGIFLLEAMACGVPVVQPRRGAFTEIVEKTGGGLLVEPDSDESIAEGILKLHDDPLLADELGSKGYSAIRELYDVAQMADSALEAYQALIEVSVPPAVAGG